MKYILKLVFLIILFVTQAQIFADTEYNIHDAVTEEQFDLIKMQYLAKAPIGTEISNMTFEGYFTLNDENYLTSVYFKDVVFKIVGKLGAVSISSNIKASFTGVMPDLSCKNPKITRATIRFTNPLFEKMFRRDKMHMYVAVLIRDYLISQSSLVTYCKIKPKLYDINNSFEDSILFEDSLPFDMDINFE